MARAVLGFNAHIHDTAAALLVDGRLVAFCEEERLNRHKHTTSFPEQSVAFCLRQAGLTIGDLDGVSFYWRPWVGLPRRTWQTLTGLPGTLVNVRRLQAGNLRAMLTVAREFRRRFGYRGPFHHTNHYLAHAYHAGFQTAFDRALVLVIDGNGEIATTLVAKLEGDKIEPVRWTPYPHSLGLLWCTVTEYLGYRQNCDEGKVMGLAPYGDDSLVPAMSRVIASQGDGTFRLDLSWFDYHLSRRHWFSDRFARVFGPPRRPDEPLNDRHRAVAYALQHVTEQTVLRLIDEMTRKLRVRHLALTGGVALNCVMNGAIASSGLVDGFYVPPAAYDAGAAVGAAIWMDREIFGCRTRDIEPSVFLGPSFDDDVCAAALSQAGVAFERPADLPARTAQLLAAGKIVGWFSGRLEGGPRALGGRSILADPRQAAMKDHLNHQVKHRESYRPFGPSVLAERADEVFHLGGRTSPYMLLAVAVREAWRNRIPAGVHVDGTARVQTVARGTQPLYWAVLHEFEALTGVPVVINTSFNIQGEPIVASPADAVRCYLGTGIDALVLGNCLTVKS